jgi:Flp pilus assembly pilin Flp
VCLTSRLSLVALRCYWRGRVRILKFCYRPDQRCPVRVGVESAEERKEEPVAKRLQQLWNDERGQDIAEYAVMLAVILVIVVGTIRLIGSNANNVFSQVGSAIQ